MGVPTLTKTRKTDIMSRRKYSIHKAPGDRLTDRERETLGIAWNGYICRCRRISLRHFARIHGIAYETWRREYNRGATYRCIFAPKLGTIQVEMGKTSWNPKTKPPRMSSCGGSLIGV